VNLSKKLLRILLMTWEVYIIQAKSGKFYTGITNDLKRRFEAHRTQRKGARFFHFSSPEKIVFREAQPNRSEASKREILIKKMKREEKVTLINSANKEVS
jgi:putative endonuclease